MTSAILFDPPPRSLEALNGDVHVFCVTLDQPSARLEQLAGTLSNDEHARSARFNFKQDRNRFIAGRGLLREILGRLLRADPARLTFAYGSRGKPRLASPVNGRMLQFNLAHSDSLAVCAVSASYELGIDIERIRPIREAEDIAARFFSARENAEWRSLPDERRAEAFFTCWTRKEAWLKAIGAGISEILNQGEVPPSSDEPGSPFKSEMVSSASSSLRLYSLKPASLYRAAVATESQGVPYCWKWVCP